MLSKIIYYSAPLDVFLRGGWVPWAGKERGWALTTILLLFFISVTWLIWPPAHDSIISASLPQKLNFLCHVLLLILRWLNYSSHFSEYIFLVNWQILRVQPSENRRLNLCHRQETDRVYFWQITKITMKKGFVCLTSSYLSTFIDGIYENANITVALQMIWCIKSINRG